MRLRRALPCWGVVALTFLPIGCGRTVNDYLVEANSGDPQVVLEAVSEIGRLLRQKEESGLPFDEGDRAALQFLRTVATESPFGLNRAAAVGSLGQIESQYEREFFLQALADEYWLTRLKAIEAVQRFGEPSIVDAVVAHLDREGQPEVRRESIKTLGILGGEQALKALFEIFLRPPPLSRPTDTQTHAYWALRRLTGLDYSEHAWESWNAAYRKRFPTPEGEGESP